MRIYHDVSDREIEHEYIQALKWRNINQKVQYLGGAADNYYKSTGSREKFFDKNKSIILGSSGVFTEVSGKGKDKEKSSYTNTSEYETFIDEYLFDASEKILLVSLGCGNGQPEKSLLLSIVEKKLKNEYLHIDFVAVDYSLRMLELAQENLADINIKKTFIRADIMSESFRKYIKKYVKNHGYTEVFYAFLGHSIVAFNPTVIAEDFYNMMTPNDWLWFDISVKPELEAIAINRYNYLIRDEFFSENLMYPLLEVGITLEHGSIKLYYSNEKESNAIRFRFVFEPRDSIYTEYSDRIYRFIKGEQITLLDIYIHDAEGIKGFMKNHGFLLFKSSKYSFEKDVFEEAQFLYKINTN